MKGIFLAVSVACGIPCMAQQAGTGIGSASSATNRMEVYSWATRPDEDGTDIQKKFIKQEWVQSEVKFKSGRPNMWVPLIFDVHNDIPYYLVGETIMEFVDSVSEFSMLVPYKKDSIIMRYRRFYPAIQANTPQTFYQVMVEGKFQLLRCQSKSILLFKDASVAEEKKKDPPKELFFVYMPGHKIAEVSFDADKIMKNMPEYEWAIRDIIKKEKLKIKDEERLVQLIVLLNNQFR